MTGGASTSGSSKTSTRPRVRERASNEVSPSDGRAPPVRGAGTRQIIPDGRAPREAAAAATSAAGCGPEARESARVRDAAAPIPRPRAPSGRRLPPARSRSPSSAAVALRAPRRAVLAHGATVPTPPDAATCLFGWSFDPLVWLPAIVALLLWCVGVRRVEPGASRAPGPAPADGLLGGRA